VDKVHKDQPVLKETHQLEIEVHKDQVDLKDHKDRIRKVLWEHREDKVHKEMHQ
jgi:hypothetical protein